MTNTILLSLGVLVLGQAFGSPLVYHPHGGHVHHHNHHHNHHQVDDVECWNEPDVDMNVTQILTRWGYPVENYKVVTPDGYIIQIQRIPKGTKGAPSNGEVAFLQHGLLSSSFDWVSNLPHESFGMILADKGYDVWMGNVRGNTYGRENVNISPNNDSFWDFSFDEFIELDLPTMIDFVLNKTGRTSLHYVGHSQGTIMMFGLLAIRPEFQDKIKAFAAMGPVANVTTITSPVKYLAPFSYDLSLILEWLGSGEFLSSNKFMRFLAKTLCYFSVSRALCEDAIFLICGIDSQQLNTTRIPVYVSHTPAGTSVRNMVHFGQEVQSGNFQKYDFGPSENMKRYNQSTPPQYDVRRIDKTPIALFWSKNDWLADPEDVAALNASLSTVKVCYKVKEDQFTHLDFLMGVKANTLVYPEVMSFLSGY